MFEPEASQMRMAVDRMLLHICRPLRRLQRASPIVERALHLSLTKVEADSVMEACDRSAVRFGAFYYWYFQKFLISRHLRSLSRERLLSKLQRLDRSDYTKLGHLHHEHINRGLLIAIPHHAHYIPTIFGIVEFLRKHRRVLVFYGAPSRHAGNELFDTLHAALYSDEGSRVSVIHDNRAGLSSALRSLRGASAVIIMPDVHTDESDTYAIPFCGRPFNVMLGTAALARRTDSVILPAISSIKGNDLSFQTIFEDAIPPPPPPTAGEPGAVCEIQHDYNVTVCIFRAYERAMANSIFLWQHARAHYSRTGDFPFLDMQAIQQISEQLLNDPRLGCLHEAPLKINLQERTQ